VDLLLLYRLVIPSNVLCLLNLVRFRPHRRPGQTDQGCPDLFDPADHVTAPAAATATATASVLHMEQRRT